MHEYKKTFVAIASFFLIGIILIIVSAILNGESPFEINAFSNLGSTNNIDDYWIVHIQTEQAVYPQVFNVALVIIGGTMVFMYVFLSQNWEYKNSGTIAIANIFGIIAGISVAMIGVFDIGTSVKFHAIFVGVLMLSATIQLFVWVYGTRDTKTPFHDDFPLIMIIVLLWALVWFGILFQFEHSFSSAIFKASLVAYLMYSLFIPIRFWFS